MQKAKQPEAPQKDDSSDEDDNLALLMGGLKGKVNVKKATKKAPNVPTQKNMNDSDEDAKHKNKKKGAKGVAKGDEEEPKKGKAQKGSDEEESKQGPTIPIKVMDEYIREAFLNAIKVQPWLYILGWCIGQKSSHWGLSIPHDLYVGLLQGEHRIGFKE